MTAIDSPTASIISNRPAELIAAFVRVNGRPAGKWVIARRLAQGRKARRRAGSSHTTFDEFACASGRGVPDASSAVAPRILHLIRCILCKMSYELHGSSPESDCRAPPCAPARRAKNGKRSHPRWLLRGCLTRSVQRLLLAVLCTPTGSRRVLQFVVGPRAMLAVTPFMLV